MKTILILMVILGTVIITPAQELKTGKTFQKKKFNTEELSDTAKYLVISPKLKPDTSENKILPFQKLPGDSFTQNNQRITDFFANHQKSEFRMPVASGGYYFNMPVSVPDSTVKYYMKVKRIDYVNPLEKNNK